MGESSSHVHRGTPGWENVLAIAKVGQRCFTVKRNRLNTALFKWLKTMKCSSEKMGF